MKKWSKEHIFKWFKAAGVRAIKTVAQSAAGTISAAFATGVIDFGIVLSTAGLAGILSLLMSLTGLPELEQATEPKTWVVSALIRVLRTVAQTGIASIGAASMINEVNWQAVAIAAGVSGLLSLLTSVAGLPELKSEP